MSFWRRYRPARAVKPVSPIRPRLEVLEDRCVPNTDMVTNLSGSSLVSGSLPFEVAHAAAGDTIIFAPTLKGGTIFLNNTLDIATILTIEGANNGITVNGGGTQRTIEIEAGNTAIINGLTITGGLAPPGFNGGGIFNLGSLVLTNSTVTGNMAAGSAGIFNAAGAKMTMAGDTVNNNTATAAGGEGGGIGNVGKLDMTNCTITANTANQGAGISNIGVLNVVNCTVALNTLTGGGANGGGIQTFGGSDQLALLNSIVFNPNSGAADVLGTIAEAQADMIAFGPVTIAPGGDKGGNKLGFSPVLGPLQDHNGPTATMALLTGSFAIGAGASTSQIPDLTVPTTDQRGDPRPANSIDMGAFQTEPAPLSFVQALYNDFLGRNGSASEWNQWVSLLPTLGQGGVAFAISHSPEALTYAVDGFYVKFLGRAAVGGEEAVWVNALEHGATEEQVISVILSSSEFAAHANALIGGANADANYVQALYQLLLHRTASMAEVNFWLGALPNGRAAVALGFLGSAEYRGDVVTGLYGTLLDRPTAPTASDVAGWVNSGLDTLAIETAFASSAEYFQNG
jgi:hypothetical protein